VWAIRFELDTSHRLRLLAPSAQAMTKESACDADDHGYTHDPRRALRDEPEAVDAATLEHYAADAHERFAGQPGRRAEHAKRQVRTQGERAKRLAAAGVDVAPALEQLAPPPRQPRTPTRGRVTVIVACVPFAWVGVLIVGIVAGMLLLKATCGSVSCDIPAHRADKPLNPKRPRRLRARPLLKR
jgi:hypothetical protein